MQHIPHSITFLLHKESAGDRHCHHFHGHFVVVLSKGHRAHTLHRPPGLDLSDDIILARDSILDVVPMDSGSRNSCLATQAILFCGCGLDLAVHSSSG